MATIQKVKRKKGHAFVAIISKKGVNLCSNLIHFRQVFAFQFDPLFWNIPQLGQGICCFLMDQFSVQILDQI